MYKWDFKYHIIWSIKHFIFKIIDGSNLLCQNKTFGLVVTLGLTENGPIERYALTLINNQNFLNSGGYKIDLHKEGYSNNRYQR